MKEKFNLSEREIKHRLYVDTWDGKDIKEFIKRLREEEATRYSFENINHILYPWRNSNSATKTLTKDIYNLILTRLNLKINRFAGDKLT